MRLTDEQPVWRRVSFWFFFVIGAIWGSIVGSWVLLDGHFPGPTITFAGRRVEHYVEGIADVSQKTSAGAWVFVWVFTLVTALACALLGTAWVRRSSPFANHRRLRYVPPEGDE